MNPQKTLIIINPVSGTNSKRNFPELFNRYLDKQKHQYELRFTERAGHATELVKEALENNIENVVAVGGDGTINEIARALVNTHAALGIIPSGSGNGLARHFKIPLKTVEAICALNNPERIKSDAATLNGHYFFCTAGVGFDAHIGQKFSEAGTRGFQTYIKTTINEFLAYKPEKYQISTPDETIEKEAFLITLANTSQYGNNAFIAPEASTSDGKLNICILEPFPVYLAPDLGRRLFTGSIHKSRFMKNLLCKSMKIKRPNNGPVHLDGEPMSMGTDLEIKCHPDVLHILIPKGKRNYENKEIVSIPE